MLGPMTHPKTLEIVRLQVGMPRTLGQANATEPMDREWTTGYFKQAVKGELAVGALGITGDGQADLVHHGGPDKAIHVYPMEHHAAWVAELGITPGPGDFGENLSTCGLCEEDVCIGDIFQTGELVLQVSQPRQPCWKLSRRWRIEDMAVRMERNGRTGWYFRVLEPGMIRAGITLELIERQLPQWTLARVNEVMHRCVDDLALALELAACPELSASWQESLHRRAAGQIIDTAPRLLGPNRKK